MRALVVPALRGLGFSNPEAIADRIAAALCEDVIAQIGVGSDHALGAATMVLGHQLDADSTVETGEDPTEMLERAHRATQGSLSSSPTDKASRYQDAGFEV